ncbi:periplasmic chaperone for outer membrane proteins SurA [Devosia enhydra]|uniref:Periplasmic chaperone for outer membrane proteins SurA n=1 Tax=Devosia enhydra TaxID=665118 RepID=A0A1K2HSW5_9HYPH|nr:peptidylprolyl isomerase [Devosia enhydra]SFZ80891.1 periplasmic chaperone for outer membrane proteins SurA [Devosia enhydra]
MKRLALGLFIAVALAAAPVTAALAATVKVSVNGSAITDVQISQRLKLFELEGKSGQTAARDELVNEAIMLQEAKRLGIEVTDKQVNDAMVNVARNIRQSYDNLLKILSSRGVPKSTLEDRLRANIAWGQVTQAAIIPRVQISDLELDKRAEQRVNAANSFDYILKEVIFVGTPGQASGRTSEANRYRSAYKGCDTAVQTSLNFRDAAVLDMGRRHATQLPEALAKELAGLNVGGITKPRTTESGVSMLAVCAKTVAEDTTFIKNNLRQEVGSEQLKGEAEKYMADLKKQARIVYH